MWSIVNSFLLFICEGGLAGAFWPYTALWIAGMSEKLYVVDGGVGSGRYNPQLEFFCKFSIWYFVSSIRQFSLIF